MGDKRKFSYKENRPWMENLQVVMQLGLTMAGSILFCFFVGLYLDKWLGLRGVFVSLFILLGIIGGSIVVYRQIMEIFTQNEKDKDKDKDKNDRGSD